MQNGIEEHENEKESQSEDQGLCFTQDEPDAPEETVETEIIVEKVAEKEMESEEVVEIEKNGHYHDGKDRTDEECQIQGKTNKSKKNLRKV